MREQQLQTNEYARQHYGFVPTTDGTYVDTSFLRQRFYGSDLGKAFARQTPRFIKRHTELSEEDALRYLGGDACPVHHQLELADIHLATVLEAEQNDGTLFAPSIEDTGLLYFVSTFHDIGESEHESLVNAGLVTVGDIPHGEKTDEDRAHEATVRRALYRTYFADVDPYFLERAEAIILHKPLPGDEHLHDLYEAAHDLQVFATVDVAAENARDPSIAAEVRAALGRFAHQVTHGRDGDSGHLAILRQRSYFAAIKDDVAQRETASTATKLTHVVDDSNRHLHLLCCQEAA
ncbi:MAG TPA: hypothetical protein VL362_00480 [Patescibacteria group bacterium]|nr:hypothetical protein [Patescibacteria group bacterium]